MKAVIYKYLKLNIKFTIGGVCGLSACEVMEGLAGKNLCFLPFCILFDPTDGHKLQVLQV